MTTMLRASAAASVAGNGRGAEVVMPSRQSRCQSSFHGRWAQLRNPHVRALAWLLDAPGLLDAQAEQWAGRVATLGPADDATVARLEALDRNGDAIEAFLNVQPLTRLGRYAENLLAWHLRSEDRLVAQNLQVRDARQQTVGEFDFLLRDGDSLVHWEFATKLYLLQTDGSDHVADYFVGPSLADTLGAKIRKIMERQLLLAWHPNAAAVLPQAVAHAQALVKGWLFYHIDTPELPLPPGIAPSHCRGFWCGLDELPRYAPRYAILPRLEWLAPARAQEGQGVDHAGLVKSLSAHFGAGGAPVLVALLEPVAGELREFDRGFVVPSDWRARARQCLTA